MEGSWNNKFPSDSIHFSKSVKWSVREIFGHEDAVYILVLSHIKDNEKSLTDFINMCNSLDFIRLDNLITAIFII